MTAISEDLQEGREVNAKWGLDHPDFPTAGYAAISSVIPTSDRLLEAAEAALEAPAAQPTDPDRDEVAFALFWAAATTLMRKHRRKDFREVVDRMRPTRDRIRDKTAHAFASAYHCVLTAQAQQSEGDLLGALRAAERAFQDVSRFPDQDPPPGPLGPSCNMFAEIVAAAAEHSEAGQRFQRVGSPKNIDAALERIDYAIDSRPHYAKYYANKSRLLSLRERDGDALDNILEAIEREDATRSDYDIRIVEYVSIRERNQMRRQFRASRREAEELREEMKGSEQRLVQVVGLLTGIVALVVAGASGADADMPTATVVGLVLALMVGIGWLTIILGFVISGTSWSRSLGAGVVLAVLALALGLVARELFEPKDAKNSANPATRVG